MSQPPGVLRFGVFEANPRTGELRKGGSRIRIQEKPFLLLLLLVERHGDIVTREELRAALWPSDTFVDFDHSLATAVAKLRVALGDSARDPKYVETIGGRGYRFLVPVSSDAVAVQPVVPASPPAPSPAPAVLEQTPDAPGIASGMATAADSARSRFRRPLIAWLAVGVAVLVGVAATTYLTRAARGAPAQVQARSLVVLPLQNLTGDPEQEYVVDGITEELIGALAQFQRLRVISRTSAMHYKGTHDRVPDIARELGVDVIVEGSVFRSGDHLRVTAQLVDGRTDRHMWARTFERDFQDVLELQPEIARAVADEITVTLRGQERPTPARRVPPAAQEAYFRGRYHLNQGDETSVRASIDDFTRALELDPENARSSASLSEALIALTDYYEHPRETMPQAKTAAERAIALDPTLAEAHAALGAVRFLYEWDFPGAETSLRTATELDPASADAHLWYAVFLGQMGRRDQAEAEASRAEALDPLSASVHTNAGWVFYMARRNDRAAEEWRQAIAIEPNVIMAHTSMWMAYLQKGGAATPSIPHLDVDKAGPLELATLAGDYAMAGRTADARRILARLHDLSSHRYVCPYEIATAHAVLGDRNEAIAWLQRGVDNRSICMPDLFSDPRLDTLRDDPRFIALLSQVGFVR